MLRSHPLFEADPADGGGTALAEKEAAADTKPEKEPDPKTVPDWRAELPEEIRDHTSLKDLDSVGALATKLISAQGMIGRDPVRVPSKTTSDDDRRAFFTAIGCPENADGYELPTENMPESVPLDDAQTKLFLAEAHDMGLTKQQAARLIRYDATRHATAITQFEETQATTHKEAEAALRKDWGDAYDEKLALAKQARDKLGTEALSKRMDESGFGLDPDFLKLLATVGRFIAEDSIIGGGPGSFHLSPEEAKAEITALEADEEFMKAYMDTTNTNPGHKAAVAKRKVLYEIAYPKALVA